MTIKLFPPPGSTLENNHMETVKCSFLSDLSSRIASLLCFWFECIIFVLKGEEKLLFL